MHGPIFRLHSGPLSLTVLSGQELVDEVCDETRFAKKLHRPLQALRDLGGDGLFTAYNDEPNWAKAHRLLMPAFGPIGVRSMFGRMEDIAEQMLQRWERFGPDAVIDVADNMTRLTLDTIALCAFDYRFNSFYQNEMHPFVAAMVGALAEAGTRARRPDLANRLLAPGRRRYEADLAMIRGVAETLIAERRADPARGLARGPAQPDAVRPRPGDRRCAVGREHPLSVGDLPDRRPRDDQRPAVVRAVPAAAPSSGDGACAPGGGRRAGHRSRRRSRTWPGCATSNRSCRKPCGCGRPHRHSRSRRAPRPRWPAATR